LYESYSTALIVQRESRINNFLSNIGIDSNNLNLSLLNKNDSNVNDFISIIKSRKLAISVIKKLKLENYKEFKLKDSYSFNKVVETFQKKLKVISPSSKDSTLVIKIRLKNKNIGEKILNQVFRELNIFLKENNYYFSTKNRTFIEKQFYRLSNELKKAEKDLLKFKQKNNTVSLTDEVQEYIKHLSEIESEIIKASIEREELKRTIETVKGKFSEFNDKWYNLVKEMEINLEASKTKKDVLNQAKNKFYKVINTLPLKALQLARLERELRIKSNLYSIFSQQLELAKLEEAKDFQQIKILDEAYSTEDPVFPKKEYFIPGSFFVSFFSTLIICLYKES
jgi:uncharacterized protein involved in exopolysaccharide biosynthesis